MSLNTQIVGDPQGCRTYGGWLRSLGDGALDTGDLLGQVRTNSEFCWGDQVGDLFRLRIEDGRRDASALYDELSRIGDAVNGFADDLATAIASMNEARTVAVQGGVPVTEHTIEPPPFPEHLADVLVPDRIDAISAESTATAAHQAHLAAYQQAARIVHRARAEEQHAHEALARRIDEQQRRLEEIRDLSRFLPLLHALTGGPAATYPHSSSWSRLAAYHRGLADEARRLLDDPAQTPHSRQHLLNQYLVNQSRAAQASRAAARLDPGAVLRGLQHSPVGRSVLQTLGTNAGRAAETGAGQAPRAVAGVMRSVPVAGVLGVGAAVAMDVAAGESPTQAVVSNGAAVTLGAVTTSVLLASSFAGPAGIGAVAAGVGIALLADYTVDQIMSE